MADSYVHDRAASFDFVFPGLPFVILNGNDFDRSHDGLAKFIPVSERDFTVDAMSWPIEGYIDCLLDLERGIRVDRDVRVIFRDGKKTGQKRMKQKR